MKFGDTQVPRRFAEYGERVAQMLHGAFLPLMQRIVGSDVVPTYAYAAVYAEGAELEPHVDKEDCEYSFSFQLDYQPEPSDGISPWPLYLSSRPPSDRRVDTKSDRAIQLANGSFLAYKGRELVHYRTALPKGHRSTSLFFHYVPA
jgi:hypothetical protein